jgi:hypothetical protein
VIDLQRSGMIFFDEILANEKLSSTAKLIAGKILSLTNCGEQECFLSNGFICKTFGLSKPTAIKAVKELELMAYIKSDVRFQPDSHLPLRYVSWIYKTSKETLPCKESLPSKDVLPSKDSLPLTSKETLPLTGKETLPKYKNINIRENNKNIESENLKNQNQPTNTNRTTLDNLNQPTNELPIDTKGISNSNQNQSTLTDLNKNIKERGAAAGGGDVKRSPYIDTPIHRFDIPTEEQIFNFFSKALTDPKNIKLYPYYQHIDAREATAIYYGNRSNNEWYRSAKKKDRVQFWNLDALNALKSWTNMRNTKKQTAEDFAKEYEQTRSFTDFLKEKEQNVLDVEYTENELPYKNY